MVQPTSVNSTGLSNRNTNKYKILLLLLLLLLLLILLLLLLLLGAEIDPVYPSNSRFKCLSLGPISRRSWYLGFNTLKIQLLGVDIWPSFGPQQGNS